MEPQVVVTSDGFRMWFLSTPHEVGPGEQPDFQLWVADRPDGVTWQVPSRFTTSDEGFFDNTVYRTPEGWEMLLARGTNLHGTSPYPGQGLWLMRAEAASPRIADWTHPVRVLDTDARGTPAWMGNGVCASSVAVRPDGARLVFLTGTHSRTRWVAAALHRIRVARRLAVPAPYFLATGSVVLSPPQG